MTVSIIIISVNLGTVVPLLLNTGDSKTWTRGKTIMVFGGLVYFAIIIAILLSELKPEALLDSSCATLEVRILFIIL